MPKKVGTYRSAKFYYYLLDSIIGELFAEGRVELHKLGTLSLERGKPRRVYDFKAGRQVVCPPRFRVKFRPSREIERRLEAMHKALETQSEET